MRKIRLNLDHSGTVYFHRELHEVFGRNAALYVQNLYFWSDKGKRKDGFIYKTKEEIRQETTLTIKEQDKVKKDLKEIGVLETKLIKANNAPTLHYKLNIGRINELLDQKAGGEIGQVGKNSDSYPGADSNITLGKNPWNTTQGQNPITVVTSKQQTEENPEVARATPLQHSGVENPAPTGVVSDFSLGVDYAPQTPHPSGELLPPAGDNTEQGVVKKATTENPDLDGMEFETSHLTPAVAKRMLQRVFEKAGANSAIPSTREFARMYKELCEEVDVIDKDSLVATAKKFLANDYYEGSHNIRLLLHPKVFISNYATKVAMREQ